MFIQEVQKQLKYYVYRLIDPRNGQTFYVGKGKGNRVFDHVNDELKNFNEQLEDEISTKMQQIRDIRLAGLEVIHIIQRHGLEEKEALEVEAALIDCFPGLSNIQSGYGIDRGINNATLLQKQLSCEEFTDLENEKYIIIKITHESLESRNRDLYETVRKYWKVNLTRANNCSYVLGVLNGIVCCVFQIDYWIQTQKEEYKGRCEFVGKEAPVEIKEYFMNKRIPLKYREKGVASPILYHD